MSDEDTMIPQTLSQNDGDSNDKNNADVFPLEVFRMLGKADEEQSILNDISTVTQNPDPIWIVIIMVIILANTKSIASKSKHRRQQSYPSWITLSALMAAFGILYQVNFDILATVVGIEETQRISASIYKPYTNFTQFYQEAYTNAHVEPSSRISHLILVAGIVSLWVNDTRLFVASAAALLVGATSTLPLAMMTAFHDDTATSMPFLEMIIVLFVGLAISRILYATMWRWLIFFLAWISLDYLDHHFLGHNGSVAIFMGQHYISWGLIGQMRLAVGLLWNNVLLGLHYFSN